MILAIYRRNTTKYLKCRGQNENKFEKGSRDIVDFYRLS
jgi:hypothetical protein